MPVMDALSQFMDDVGRLGDAEILRVAVQARMHEQLPSVADARAVARDVVVRTDRVSQLGTLSAALRQWAASSDGSGEWGTDVSMPPRLLAFPLLADALLAEVAGTDLDEASRRVLLASWISARPDRMTRSNAT
jgi:hypothetical protein